MPTKSISMQALCGSRVQRSWKRLRRVRVLQVLKRGQQVKKTVDLAEGATVKAAWLLSQEVSTGVGMQQVSELDSQDVVSKLSQLFPSCLDWSPLRE